jgi:tetratricopeptide (TPR) repeat protein
VSERIAPEDSGELRRTPVIQLLWDVAARRFTGTLVVTAEADAGPLAGTSHYSFTEGRLTQASLPQPLDTLGQVLVEQGRIDSAKLDASLLRLARKEGLQGEILVAMGAVDVAAVEAALREQLARKLVRLFGVAQGRWERHEGRDLLASFGGRRFPVETAELLWLGTRAHPRHPAIDEVLRRVGDQGIRLRADARRALFGSAPDVVAMLDAIARGATIAGLGAAGHSALLTRAAVFFLAMTRQLERAEAPGPVGRVSQMEVPVIRNLPPPPKAISNTNLPAVRGPSIAAIAAEAHTVAAEPHGDVRARTAEAEAMLARLEKLNAFEVLGLPLDAPPLAVNAAFQRVATRWHPEAISVSLPDLREVYAKIFALLAEADATLAHPAAREQHLRDMAAGKATALDRRARAQRHALRLRGENALRMQTWTEAERVARELAADDPADLEAKLLLAGALVQGRATLPTEEVRKNIAAVLEKVPEHDRAHVLAAQLYRRLGDERRALGHYVRAYKSNPRNTDAIRELRLAVMRRREASSEEGEMLAGIARLMGLKT